MPEALQAALDLIADMQQLLVDMNDAADEKDRQIAALTEEHASFRAEASDGAGRVAEHRMWFDTFRAARQPPAKAPDA